MRPEFDARDQELLDKRIRLWNERTEARVGDYVEMLDGSLRRFTYRWPQDDLMQVTSGTGNVENHGGFYMTTDGYMSYSGGLDPGIPLASVVDTGKVKEALVWFFHHDFAGADRAVYGKIPCRIYRQT